MYISTKLTFSAIFALCCLALGYTIRTQTDDSAYSSTVSHIYITMYDAFENACVTTRLDYDVDNFELGS